MTKVGVTFIRMVTEGYITDVLTDAALAFIEKNRKRPFICYLPYNAPHHPYQVPPQYLKKYVERGFDEKTATVYGMVENIDDNMARILSKLDEWQLTDDTIVIFTSDNGPTGRIRYNGGMRGQKASVDEGGVRVPLFIRWPGHIEAGSIVSQIAAHVDLFPTLVGLCGVPMPETLPQDGRSLAPLLLGKPVDWPDRMIFAHQNQFGETHLTPGGVRTQTHRLVDRGDGYELYDMVADPGQAKDIADEQPELAKRLASAYESWFADVTSRGLDPPPLPVGYPSMAAVALQGEDSKLSEGLKFHRGYGWAHDSVLNWRSSKDSMTWKLDVLRGGSYDITLMYGCLSGDVGTQVRIEVDGQQAEATVEVAHDPVPPARILKDRKSVRTSGPVPLMTWRPLTFSGIKLSKGPASLVVRTNPTGQDFEVKEASFQQVK
jgi:hypothetical protein